MRTDKSMIEVAYDVLSASEGSMSFVDLANKVADILEMNEEEKTARLGALYTSLSLNGKFVTLSDNKWDLRSRHTYAKVHIDVNAVYTEMEENSDPSESQNGDENGESKENEDENLDDEENEEDAKGMSDEEIESLGINK